MTGGGTGRFIKASRYRLSDRNVSSNVCCLRFLIEFITFRILRPRSVRPSSAVVVSSPVGPLSKAPLLPAISDHDNVVAVTEGPARADLDPVWDKGFCRLALPAHGWSGDIDEGSSGYSESPVFSDLARRCTASKDVLDSNLFCGRIRFSFP